MNADVLRARVTALAQWRRANEQAPHKPLLLLLALADLYKEGQRWLYFNDVEPRLNKLLGEFGTGRTTKAQYPFWRLQTDGIWTIPEARQFATNTSGDVSVTALREANAQAGFSDEVYNLLRTERGLAGDLINRILDCHFPESMHEDIRQALDVSGISLVREEIVQYRTTESQRRDSRFRELVLGAYRYHCAVCGFQLRLGDTLVGLDAAHIKWHQAGGPAVVQNGLALCVLHHKLFDRGVFTLLDEMTIAVSNLANGSASLDLHLTPYHGRTVSRPVEDQHIPSQEYIAWHRAQVFHT